MLLGLILMVMLRESIRSRLRRVLALGRTIQRNTLQFCQLRMVGWQMRLLEELFLLQQLPPVFLSPLVPEAQRLPQVLAEQHSLLNLPIKVYPIHRKYSGQGFHRKMATG